MSKVFYRFIVPEDVLDVARIARETFDNSPLINDSIDDALRDVFSNTRWKHRVWVAISLDGEEGEIVGFGGWNYFWANYDMACFSWCGVAEKWRGRGIGRGLVEVRIRDIRKTDEGLSLVFVNTYLPEMYERYGFETIAVHDLRSGPGEHLMRLDLRVPDSFYRPGGPWEKQK